MPINAVNKTGQADGVVVWVRLKVSVAGIQFGWSKKVSEDMTFELRLEG